MLLFKVMNVLITRPKRQAQLLAEQLQALGHVGICLPVIAITPPHSLVSMQQTLEKLTTFDMLIFISPNTVTEFVKYLNTTESLPCVLAVGKGTALSLQQQQVNVTDYPKTANSLSLLALPKLQQVAGKKIAIFAGEDGKTLLADTLQERGADVSTVYTHRRAIPKYQLPFAWQSERIDVSVCTSVTGLHYFHAIIKSYKLNELFSKGLVVISEPMQIIARRLGFKSAIIIANDASDSAIILALQLYAKENYGQSTYEGKFGS